MVYNRQFLLRKEIPHDIRMIEVTRVSLFVLYINTEIVAGYDQSGKGLPE